MTKAELLDMLYRACRLYADQCGLDAPDWIRMIANANPQRLEAAAQEARADDALEETGEI